MDNTSAPANSKPTSGHRRIQFENFKFVDVNPNASLPQLKCCLTKCCSENRQDVTTRNKQPTLSAYKVRQQPSIFGSKTPLKVLKSELESDEIKPARTMNISKPQSDMECASPVTPVSILKKSELKASQQKEKAFECTMRPTMNDSFDDESVDELLEKCCASAGNEAKLKRCIDESQAQQYTGSQEESPRGKTIGLTEYVGHGIGVKRKSIGSTNSSKATSWRVDMSAEARSVLSSLKGNEPMSISFLIELYRGKLNKNRQDTAMRMGYVKWKMFGRGVQLSAHDVNQFFHAMIKNGFLQETQVCGKYQNKCSYLRVSQKGHDFVEGKGRYAVDLNPAYDTAEKKPRKNETHVTFNLNDTKQPMTNVKKPDKVEPFERRIGSESDKEIGKYEVFGFAIGHFYNDLCASMWFTYLMIFMEKVLLMHSYHAGFLMLVGQVTDALSTPLVGLLSDASFLPSKVTQRLGRRKSWHVIGTICVTISFPFIFGKCLLCHKTASEWWKMTWFIPFIMMFQFGWACVQISHLSMIPELSRSEAKRMSMNSFRYGFTVVANLAIFGCLYLLLNGSAGMSTVIGPHDLHTFRNLGAIAVGVGLITTAIFYLSIKEPPNRRSLSRSNSFHSQSSEIVRMSWKNWFSHVHFYQTALLYMFARLFINISQVYFPFYITLSQGKSKEYVAILPMLSYIASFVVSCVLGSPTVSNRLDRKWLFLGGTTFGILNCAFMMFELPGIDIFGVALLLGLTQATLLISSLGITASLINKNTETSAFVYGSMSFLDKFSNGIACQIIEILNPSCKPEHSIESCKRFYRYVMVFIPGGSAIAIFVILLTLNATTLGVRRRLRSQNDQEDQEQIVG
ncbi:MFS/sugar transport protein [Ditylenchus destructor]|nr:MFS/sugar transport protein [Ditylenchus destructor]